MPQDVVQIGGLTISKYVLDVVFPLIGTLIGGLITYLATRGVESYRHAQAKQDARQQQQRQALALALEWIDPIKHAVWKATAMTRAVIEDDIDEDTYRTDFPDLNHELVPKDIPATLRVFLPDGTYLRSHLICGSLEELHIMTLRFKAREQIDPKARLEAFGRYLEKVSQLDRAVKQLEDDLFRQYSATFE